MVTGMGFIVFCVFWLLLKLGRLDREEAIYFLLFSSPFFISSFLIAIICYSDVQWIDVLILNTDLSVIKFLYMLGLSTVIYSMVNLIVPSKVCRAYRLQSDNDR